MAYDLSRLVFSGSDDVNAIYDDLQRVCIGRVAIVWLGNI